jgi:hypothetical protein
MGIDPREMLPNLAPFADALKVAKVELSVRDALRALGQARAHALTFESWNRNVFDARKEAAQLDKELPRDLNWMMTVILKNDGSVPIEHQARLLEVVILRGADERPFLVMQAAVRAFERAGWEDHEDIQPTAERVKYQLAAMTAMTVGPPALFDQLSRSADQLPTGRAPATELMNTMLRAGGVAGSHEQRQPVETWLKDLPPETRGRAMYHIRDAAEAKEIGKVTQVTGFEVGVGPASFGLQWEPGPETHWKVVGDDLRLGVMRDLDDKPEQKVAFYTGYMKADPGLDDPKEVVRGK